MGGQELMTREAAAATRDHEHGQDLDSPPAMAGTSVAEPDGRARMVAIADGSDRSLRSDSAGRVPSTIPSGRDEYVTEWDPRLG